MASQPGKNIRNCITNYRFLGIFDGLTASNPVQIDFFSKQTTIAEILNVNEKSGPNSYKIIDRRKF